MCVHECVRDVMVCVVGVLRDNGLECVQVWID